MSRHHRCHLLLCAAIPYLSCCDRTAAMFEDAALAVRRWTASSLCCCLPLLPLLLLLLPPAETETCHLEVDRSVGIRAVTTPVDPRSPYFTAMRNVSQVENAVAHYEALARGADLVSGLDRVQLVLGFSLGLYFWFQKCSYSWLNRCDVAHTLLLLLTPFEFSAPDMCACCCCLPAGCVCGL